MLRTHEASELFLPLPQCSGSLQPKVCAQLDHDRLPSEGPSLPHQDLLEAEGRQGRGQPGETENSGGGGLWEKAAEALVLLPLS